MKKEYIVSYTYQEVGGRAVNQIVGTFKSKEAAEKALEAAEKALEAAVKHIFKQNCLDEAQKEYCIINKNNFSLTDSDDSFLAKGFIDEREPGKVYLD